MKQIKYKPEKRTEEEREAIMKQLRKEAISNFVLTALAVLTASAILTTIVFMFM